MIYASLKPIRAWRNVWVVPNYLLLAAMTGGLWLATLLHGFGRAERWHGELLLLVGRVVALAHDHHSDRIDELLPARVLPALEQLQDPGERDVQPSGELELALDQVQMALDRLG